MTLHVHRAERADALVPALAAVLATPPADVFDQDVIAVPARGVERWITQRVSHFLGSRAGRADGVCAAVRFPSPTALIAEVMAHVGAIGPAGGIGTASDPGTRSMADADPWAAECMVWTLLEVIDECASEPWCLALGAHLGVAAADPAAEYRQGRRYAVARRLAGLFAQYGAQRPGMLARWAAGEDSDGIDGPVPADLAWQPELWRRLRDRIAAPDPAARLDIADRRLAEAPGDVPLPQRISVFGPTALPTAQLRVLQALAGDRDVHLWLPHPSPAMWAALDRATAVPAVRHPRPSGTQRTQRAQGTRWTQWTPVPRRLDATGATARNPLLAALGRDSRELHTTLSGAEHVDHHHPAPPVGTSLLHLLQDRVRTDSGPGGTGSLPAVDRWDRSVQVHACHGESRQVEVLRDVLAGLLADGHQPDAVGTRRESPDPADILVMCPDIESYAPLIQAAFGLGEVIESGHPAHTLRVRLADRALRQTNPLLTVVGRLLELAGSRVTASEVLDLAAFDPVRRRFGFDDDDLEQLGVWSREAGVRWGLDADHREPFALSGYPQNTWRAGLDRLLTGVAMAEEDRQWLGVALPLEDVGSSDIEVVGRFAEFVQRLGTALDRLSGRQPLGGWLDELTLAVRTLTAVPQSQSWQLAQLGREFAALTAQAGARDGVGHPGGPGRVPLARSDIRAVLQATLAGRPTRANFRTGTLTVCTMVPMRSVPHEVVCLLGLDDGIFPRSAHRDGDDILAREPAVGERDPRSEDRQLMLDAIMAARRTLVITYSGADERTGVVRPPAVPLGELLDELDETAVTAAGGPLRDQVVVRHPLQPFSPRAVTAGALGVPRPFSFDPAALAGARAAAAPRLEPGAFLPGPLPPPVARDVELDALQAFCRHPARAFLRQRLEIAVDSQEIEPSDALPVELNGLERWAIGDRMLQGRLAGVDEPTLEAVEWRRGAVPPGPLGRAELSRVAEKVEALVTGTAELRAAPAGPVDVTVPLGDDRRLTGTIPGVHGEHLVAVSYSSLKPAHRLIAWVSLLALTAAFPARTWWATTVGGGAGRARCAKIAPLTADAAAGILRQVVDLYDRGRTEPLPLPTTTAERYAGARFTGADVTEARKAAEKEWVGSQKYPGERDDAAHQQVWGRQVTLAGLLTLSPAADERWFPDEQSRFGQLARRVWQPLLERESLGRL